VIAREAQLMSPTCGSVVEVLVDELSGSRVSNCTARDAVGAKHTSLEAFAMSLKAGGGNLGTIFSTLTYSDMIVLVGVRIWGVRGIVVVVLWTGAKIKNTCSCSGLAAALTAFYGPQITLDQTADNVHPVTLRLLSRRAMPSHPSSDHAWMLVLRLPAAIALHNQGRASSGIVIPHFLPLNQKQCT
jgi:hypothetical protein